VIGHYVRDEKVISLAEAIRKLTNLAATNLHIKQRGQLTPGYFADIVVFDPAKVKDLATYENPHQYAEGMLHVWVNGTQVLKNGQHTNAKPGRFVKGPGYKKQ
jgi:N-acyl-D-amino-acid deacylase